MKKREAARWWREVQLQPILRTYVTPKKPKKLEREAYLDIPHRGWNDLRLLGRRTLTQLRCGTNFLRIHTARYTHTEAQHRYCCLCADGVSIEDERHFLLDCTEYTDRRKQFWIDVTRIVRESATKIDGELPFDAELLSRNEQFELLTCSSSLASIRGAVCHRRVMSRVLIEIAEWRRLRDRFVALLERAAALAANE